MIMTCLYWKLPADKIKIDFSTGCNNNSDDMSLFFGLSVRPL